MNHESALRKMLGARHRALDEDASMMNAIYPPRVGDVVTAGGRPQRMTVVAAGRESCCCLWWDEGHACYHQMYCAPGELTVHAAGELAHVGDKVRLPSGGPEMKADKLDDDGNLRCRWQEDGQRRTLFVDPRALEVLR